MSPTQAGAWTAYNNVALAGIDTFVARAASAGAGGVIEIHLDSPSGALLGTCMMPGTDDAQTYVNAYVTLTTTNGIHTVYLVYPGGAGGQLGVEYFGFFKASPALSHQ